MNNPLDDLGAISHRILRLQDELKKAQTEKAAAIRRVNEGGIPKCHVGAIIRSDLTFHGFEAQQIRRLGLSDASIRLVLDRA